MNKALPKSAEECRKLLVEGQTSTAAIRDDQVKLSQKFVDLIVLDSKILTPDNLKALTGLIALGGKEVIPLLTAVVKEHPSKEVIERAGKIAAFAFAFDQLLDWFQKKLDS